MFAPISQSVAIRTTFNDEVVNGLLRQYFPKRTNLAVRSRAYLDLVAAELNDRPRLVLADRTQRDVLAHFLLAQPNP